MLLSHNYPGLNNKVESEKTLFILIAALELFIQGQVRDHVIAHAQIAFLQPSAGQWSWLYLQPCLHKFES